MTATQRLVNQQEVQRAYNLLSAGQVVEIRALEASFDTSRYTSTIGGYFDNVQDLTREISRLRQALGIYITLQPCHPNLLYKAKNKLNPQKSAEATPDKYITEYRWLLIDSDPERLTGISSSDDEHNQALAQSAFIRNELRAVGWPDPISADSGNGAHLLYRLDLPVEEKDLVKRTLTGLAERYSTDAIKVDTTVFNPARICKLYGTLACKGDNTTERPHRFSQLLEVPDDLQIVTREQLEQVATPVSTQITMPQPQKHAYSTSPEGFTAEQFLNKHHISVKSSGEYDKGIRYKLDACVWDASHTDNSACVYQDAQGRLGASCSHHSCQGKGWREFRLVFEPSAYDVKPQKQKATKAKPQIVESELGQEDDKEVDLCSFTPDDAGNGDAIYAVYGRNFLFCSAYGWLTYTGTHWKRLSDDSTIKQATVKVLRSRRVAAVRAQIEAIVKCTIADAKKVNGAIDRFKSLVSVPVEVFDNEPDYFNALNGIVDLRTGALEPHSHTQRFTWCAAVPYAPGDCSLWLQQLHETLAGGHEMIDYLQLALGYSLTGRTSEECLFYPYGPTRSGKGTLAETISALLPSPIAESIDFTSLTARRTEDTNNFDLARLKPSRIVFASESNRSQPLNPSKIKTITGGDSITASHKHKDAFTYKPQFKLWLLSNWPVNGDPEDDALWGRVRVIEFPHSFLGKEDKSKKVKLRSLESLQAILYWCVQGAIKWYALGSQGLPIPVQVAASTADARDKLDFVKQWLEECTEQGEWVSNEFINTSYIKWCEENNVTAKKARGLSLSLQNKGYATGVLKRIGTKVAKGVAGLRLKSITDNDPDDFEEVCNGLKNEKSSDLSTKCNGLKNVTDVTDETQEKPLYAYKGTSSELSVTTVTVTKNTPEQEAYRDLYKQLQTHLLASSQNEYAWNATEVLPRSAFCKRVGEYLKSGTQHKIDYALHLVARELGEVGL